MNPGGSFKNALTCREIMPSSYLVLYFGLEHQRRSRMVQKTQIFTNTFFPETPVNTITGLTTKDKTTSNVLNMNIEYEG